MENISLDEYMSLMCAGTYLAGISVEEVEEMSVGYHAFWQTLNEDQRMWLSRSMYAAILCDEMITQKEKNEGYISPSWN